VITELEAPRQGREPGNNRQRLLNTAASESDSRNESTVANSKYMDLVLFIKTVTLFWRGIVAQGQHINIIALGV
jgi:hypothetical protein